MNRWLLCVLVVGVSGAVSAETLQEYAQKCDEAIGLTVPNFNCDDVGFVTVPTTGLDCSTGTCLCDRPNVLNGVCDPGSKSRILAQNATAFVVANCRKQGLGSGLYNDIAVIQHNTSNGATCFYQAGLNNSRAAAVPAPLAGVGSPKAWMTPGEIAGSSFPCASCHDNGAIIRSPYLTQLGSTQFPGAGSTTFNSATSPYFFVGSDFANWRVYDVSVDGNTCVSCHRLGVNNLSLTRGTSRKFARVATAQSQASKNPHSSQSPLWMLSGQSTFSQANFDAALQIEACGNQFTASGPLPNSPNCRIKPINLYSRAPGKTLNGAMYTVWRPSDGVWSIIKQTDSDRLFEQWGQAGDKPVPGDYDKDGLVDLATWREADGYWYAIKSSDGTTFSVQWGGPGDVPVPADYDGDGFTDVAVWRPSEGYWYIRRSSDGTVVTQQWGQSGDVPVPARYDGDLRADIAIWRPSEGYWYVLRSSDGVVQTKQWGTNGDKPVPADFDGNGTVEYAVWRPSEGYWYIKNVATGAVRTQQWGTAGDDPVPGRYVGGDPQVDFAIWRPSEGYWYIKDSVTGAVTAKQWGRAGDVAIAPR